MICPICKKGQTRVVETRESSTATRRRRECITCKKRFTTYERYEEPILTVIKKDGRVEKYSRKKIFNGILTACHKRPVSTNAIEKIINEVERDLLKTKKKKISSEEIGKLVLKHLKKLDLVAYLRFASVYLNFSNLERFKNEIEALLKPEAAKKGDLYHAKKS